jgi:hypothetical protein
MLATASAPKPKRRVVAGSGTTVVLDVVALMKPLILPDPPDGTAVLKTHTSRTPDSGPEENGTDNVKGLNTTLTPPEKLVDTTPKI